jgi:hypothetical protein
MPPTRGSTSTYPSIRAFRALTYIDIRLCIPFPKFQCIRETLPAHLLVPSSSPGRDEQAYVSSAPRQPQSSASTQSGPCDYWCVHFTLCRSVYPPALLSSFVFC